MKTKTAYGEYALERKIVEYLWMAENKQSITDIANGLECNVHASNINRVLLDLMRILPKAITRVKMPDWPKKTPGRPYLYTIHRKKYITSTQLMEAYSKNRAELWGKLGTNKKKTRDAERKRLEREVKKVVMGKNQHEFDFKNSNIVPAATPQEIENILNRKLDEKLAYLSSQIDKLQTKLEKIDQLVEYLNRPESISKPSPIKSWFGFSSK